MYSERAVADLERVEAWLTQAGSGPAARQRLASIVSAIDGLDRVPCFYRAGIAPGTRVMICERHRIIYEVVPDTGSNLTSGDITILRVLGPGTA